MYKQRRGKAAVDADAGPTLARKAATVNQKDNCLRNQQGLWRCSPTCRLDACHQTWAGRVKQKLMHRAREGSLVATYQDSPQRCAIAS